MEVPVEAADRTVDLAGLVQHPKDVQVEQEQLRLILLAAAAAQVVSAQLEPVPAEEQVARVAQEQPQTLLEAR